MPTCLRSTFTLTQGLSSPGALLTVLVVTAILGSCLLSWFSSGLFRQCSLGLGHSALKLRLHLPPTARCPSWYHLTGPLPLATILRAISLGCKSERGLFPRDALGSLKLNLLSSSPLTRGVFPGRGLSLTVAAQHSQTQTSFYLDIQNVASAHFGGFRGFTAYLGTFNPESLLSCPLSP